MNPANEKSFSRAVLFLGVCYLALQFAYIFRLPLVMDEFDGAYDVYRLTSELPYRDFKPYKTVLGYYVQLPALLVASDVWGGLMLVKSQMALINCIFLVLGALMLARHYRQSAVLAGMLLFVMMSTWLERSSTLRVDTLTAWAGFFSLMYLLRGRALCAGALAGLSFLFSQKGVYFLAAAEAALVLEWLLLERSRRGLERLIIFNIAAGLLIGGYFAVWGLFGSGQSASQATFSSHYEIVFKEMYRDIFWRFWDQTLRRNPFFYGLNAAALLLLLWQCGWGLFRGKESEREQTCWALRLLIYGSAMWSFALWHKQPWPYFFVLLIPTCAVLNVHACAGLMPVIRKSPHLVQAGVLIAFLYLAVVYPGQRIAKVFERDSAYQRHMVELAAAFLVEGEAYVAGTDILYNRRHSTGRLSRLNRTKRKRLQSARKAYIEQTIEGLRRNPPKIWIKNYRKKAFRGELKKFFEENYRHFWGSIYLYAPQFNEGVEECFIGYSGVYKMRSEDPGSIELNGRVISRGETLQLEKGLYPCAAVSPFQLQLGAPPDLRYLVKPEFKKYRRLFKDYYTY